MVLSLTRLHRAETASEWLQRLVAVATVVGWLLLAGLVASLYIGHSPSPYGMCTTASGRSVSCAILHR